MSGKTKQRGNSRRRDQIIVTSRDHQPVAPFASEQFSGPLPHPETLHQYDLLIPGAAERILAMAETAAAHQRELDVAALKATVSEVKRGQVFGIVTVILAFTTAVVALFLGSEKTAMAIGGTTVVGLVTAFVTGRILQRGEPR
ncbi:MAG: DUF2335 domain-containing protein [Thermodesulfobacteriota bacterium]